MKKIRVFTDGACSENPGPGGWAVVFCDKNGFRKFTGRERSTTNNRMELMAVRCALRKILNSKTRCEYEILSDSSYCVNSIKNKWVYNWVRNDWKTSAKEPVKNKDIWENVVELLALIHDKNIIVKFTKIKGHAGNTFNEMVDKLAKEEVQKMKKEIDHEKKKSIKNNC